MARVAAKDPGSPRPVVKWAGGKSALAPRLLAHFPRKIGTYVEPFCGGAAVFFALAAEPRRRFAHAVLTDQNEDLIALYRALQTDVATLAGRLAELADRHLALDDAARERHYYEVREATPPQGDLVARAARLVFLNKTCFNGLWRVNASGRNNVPFGRYTRPKIYDPDALRAASRALAGVELHVADFEAVTAPLRKGDFVYFDPPYVPLSRTASFTAYAAGGFGPDDQRRLVATLGRLRDRDVRAILSNACSPDTRALYEGFHQDVVPMRRSINSDVKKRGLVDELVVSTHELRARSDDRAAS